jgi:PilZ domain
MDRRRFERVRVDYPATFSGRSSRASSTILDLSTCGCRARAAFLVNRDDCLGVLIDVPKYEEPIYVARAVVRWSHEDEFGMEFTDMDTEDHQRLCEVVME